MTRKKLREFAKAMFKASFRDGAIDPRKVHNVIKVANNLRTTGLISVLRTYRRLVENQLAKETVIIEVNNKSSIKSDQEKLILKKTGATTLVYKVNPHVIFGARITHGDWVWDSTLKAKLDQLTNV